VTSFCFHKEAARSKNSLQIIIIINLCSPTFRGKEKLRLMV